MVLGLGKSGEHNYCLLPSKNQKPEVRVIGRTQSPMFNHLYAIAIAFALISIVFAGCKGESTTLSKDARLVGKWKLESRQELDNGHYVVATNEYEFLEDGTFENVSTTELLNGDTNEPFVISTTKEAGTWIVDGNETIWTTTKAELTDFKSYTDQISRSMIEDDLSAEAPPERFAILSANSEIVTLRDATSGSELVLNRISEDSATDSEQTAHSSPGVLFNGVSLDGWEISKYPGRKDVNVSDGAIVMEAGTPVAGIHRFFDKHPPKKDYEVSLEAKRIQGSDYVCSLTFPVHDSECTFIVGGWFGRVAGLSMVDNKNAQNNETASSIELENDRWYQIKVRVTEDTIACWIDDKQVVDQPINGHTFARHNNLLKIGELSLCAYESKVAYRKILLRDLSNETEFKKR